MSLLGRLIGSPFIASIDVSGAHEDKKNSAYVVHGYLVPQGYMAYILDSSYPIEYIMNLSQYFPKASILYNVSTTEVFGDYDVVSVNENGNIQIVFQDSSSDNVLFITNKCNSNCIMCPDSNAHRRRDLGNQKTRLERIIGLMPSDTPHITITGGEPTLLKWDFIDILAQCKEKFTQTNFLMLSNGRTLSNNEYREAFLESLPNHFRLAVPIYGSNAFDHDRITRAEGSFAQTMYALSHLQKHLDLEIRIVVMRNNYQKLPHIAEFLVQNLPCTYTVSFMGMELLGNAAVNRTGLWIDYDDTVFYVGEAIKILLSSGIDARIYNYPLCKVPKNLWPITVKSITEYKIRYKDECSVCSQRDLCGGFFFSTLHFQNTPVQPIIEGYANEKQF